MEIIWKKDEHDSRMVIMMRDPDSGDIFSSTSVKRKTISNFNQLS